MVTVESSAHSAKRLPHSHGERERRDKARDFLADKEGAEILIQYSIPEDREKREKQGVCSFSRNRLGGIAGVIIDSEPIPLEDIYDYKLIGVKAS